MAHHRERAYRLGIAVALCADTALHDEALARAPAMLKLAPLVQTEMKRLIRQGADASQPVEQSLEQEVLLRLYKSADAQEGISAFLGKREPIFSGR